MDFLLLAQTGRDETSRKIARIIQGEEVLISWNGILVGLATAAVIMYGIVAYRWWRERCGNPTICLMSETCAARIWENSQTVSLPDFCPNAPMKYSLRSLMHV